MEALMQLRKTRIWNGARQGKPLERLASGVGWKLIGTSLHEPASSAPFRGLPHTAGSAGGRDSTNFDEYHVSFFPPGVPKLPLASKCL